MSSLFSKTPGTFQRKESTNISLVCTKQSILKETSKEVSYKPLLDTTNEGLNLTQQTWKEVQKPSECGIAIVSKGYSSEQELFQAPPIDELVCNLVAQICLIPEAADETHLKNDCSEVNNEKAKNMGNLVIIESDMGYDSSKQSLSGPDALLLNENGMEFSKLSHLTHHGEGAIKLKSMLHGNCEKSGTGQRSKLHVTWAPDVHDPPCSSTSHTVSQSLRKHHNPKNDRKGHKSKGSSTHKGKSNIHGDSSHKKPQKKLTRKLRHASEALITSSTHTIGAQRIRQSNNYISGATIDIVSDRSSIKSPRFDSLLLSPKNYSLNQVFSFREKELTTFDTHIPLSQWWSDS